MVLMVFHLEIRPFHCDLFKWHLLNLEIKPSIFLSPFSNMHFENELNNTAIKCNSRGFFVMDFTENMLQSPHSSINGSSLWIARYTTVSLYFSKCLISETSFVFLFLKRGSKKITIEVGKQFRFLQNNTVYRKSSFPNDWSFIWEPRVGASQVIA